MLEHLQQNPEREQTLQFVNKQNEPNETVSFARNGQLRRKTTGNGKISTGIHNKAKYAQNAERSMNQEAVRRSAKHATTAKSRTISQKCVE